MCARLSDAPAQGPESHSPEACSRGTPTDTPGIEGYILIGLDKLIFGKRRQPVVTQAVSHGVQVLGMRAGGDRPWPGRQR
jgi:hypothetical protein